MIAPMTSQAPRRLNVLVVGDEHNTVMNLGILLRSEGVDVRLAIGADQVPAAVEEFQPDAVLLDIPTTNSRFAVAQALMKSCGTRVPVLHHVARPINPDAILTLVLSINPS
jgi:DNA-binding response OmpR family regulator